MSPLNGTAVNGGVNADQVPISSPSLRHVCLELQDKVDAFLAEDVNSKALKAVQAQVKEAVGVIHEALDRYRYATAALFAIADRIREPLLTDSPMRMAIVLKSSPSRTMAERTASSCSC